MTRTIKSKQFSQIKFTNIQTPSPMNRNPTRKTFVFLLANIIMMQTVLAKIDNISTKDVISGESGWGTGDLEPLNVQNCELEM